MDLKARLIEVIGTFFLFLTIAINAISPSVSTTAFFSVAAMVTVLTYVSRSISGAHFNPAISLAVWIRGLGSFNLMLSYVLAQFTGVVICFAPLYFLSDIGGISENGFVPKQIFIAEYLFTFLLIFTFLKLTLNKNLRENSYFGLAIGLVYLVAICVVSSLSGAVLNPAMVLGLAVLRVINPDQIIYYISAEILAALTAAYLALFFIEEN